MATDGRSEQPGSPALPSTRRLSATGLGLPSSGAPPRPVKQGREPRLPESHRRALSVLVDRLSGADVRWAVTGSVAFALHGVVIVPRDLDISTDRGGAYALEQAFADEVVERVKPLVSDRLRTLRGLLSLEGVPVEIVGDIRRRLRSGRWGRPVNPLRHAIVLMVDGVEVPVLTPKYLYRAYMQLGRAEKAALLRPLLEHRADQALVLLRS